MLKIGTQGIAAMRLGTQEIKKAYLGGALVFGAGEGPGPSRLPEGYTEVEYIESDGASYISTEVRPINTNNTPVRTIIDVEPLDDPTSTTKYILNSGGTYNGTTYGYRVTWKTPNGAYGVIATTTSNAVKDTDPRRMTLELNSNTLKFSEDGTAVSVGTTKYLPNPMSNILIFGNSGTTTTNKIRAKLYSCKIYYGSSLPLVRDFVPCIDPTGAVGLYDLVGGEFYGNSGTGTLTAGPAV